MYSELGYSHLNQISLDSCTWTGITAGAAKGAQP